jgi:hypothetical protein
MMTELELKQKLNTYLRSSISMRVHNNRSRYLAILKKWFRYEIHLHEIFLSAEEEVICALAHYIKTKKKEYYFIVRKYALENLLKKDYTERVIDKNLRIQGQVFNLQELLKEIFSTYFPDQMNFIKITWRNEPTRCVKRSLVLGSYSKQLQLIRINSLLDCKDCSKTLVSYIIYHEVLHAFYPVQIGETGQRKVHTQEFKKMEKRFIGYEQAKIDEKQFLKNVLLHNLSWRKSHVRS